MEFEKLTVKTPDRIGLMMKVREYNKGTINFRPNGFVYVYWDKNKIDVWSGTFSFQITTKEEK